MSTVLEVSQIEKAFGAVSVLRGVDLQIASGEVHAVLGENGAGKSTLMKILLGIERADRGVMRLPNNVPEEQTYAPRNPLEARELGVVMVPQERTLCPDLSVLENVVLGLEPVTAGGFIRTADARVAAEKALGLVTGAGRRIPLDVRARYLGVADQQLVEIARALAQADVAHQRDAGGDANAPRATARVLILDEPTSSLGHDDAGRLFARIQTLKSVGLAIVLVTHFLVDVRTHADRYTVLRDGKVHGAGDPKTTPPEQIVREMLGRELESALDDTTTALTTRDDDQAALHSPPLLVVKSLGGSERPRSASFELHRGEVFGIAGLVGSGRTELLRLILGLDSPVRGEVVINAQKGVGLLSEDRAGEGLMLGRSIGENIMLSSRGPFISWPSAILKEGARWLTDLSVRAAGPDQAVGELSGGNQQKVQIARLLREDYDVLLIDEPTRGIDVASKAQVLTLLRDLAKRGKGIVLVSSQLDELVSTCDRIAVLRRGELDAPRPASEWTEEKLLLEASS